MPLNVFNLNVPSIAIGLFNTGHGVSIELKYALGVQFQTLGGPLDEPFVLKNFHLHWPSEHTLDGRRFAAEIHLVHFNKKYQSFEIASSKPDGLAVLGFLLEIDDTVTVKRATRYIKLFKNVRQPYREDVDVDTKDQISVAEIIGPEPIYVYNYQGSLTTPPCTENVNWMIATRTLKITGSELEEMKKVRFNDGLTILNNFRPVQHLWGRRILTY